MNIVDSSKIQKKMNNNSFISLILKFSVASWVNFIISIISTMILTRVFPPNIYGTLNIFNSASNLLMGFFCLGLDSGLLRFYYERDTKEDKKNLFLKSVLIPVFFLGIFSTISILFFSDTISNNIFGQRSTLLVGFLFIKTISILLLRFFNIWYRVTGNIKMYTVQNILVHFFSKAFVLLSVLVHISISNILFFNVFGIFILLIIYLFIQRKEVIPEKINLSYRGFSEVFKFTIFVWPISFVTYLNVFASQLIVKGVLDAHQLGIFTSVRFFIGILGVFQTGFMTFWATFMYKYHETEKEKVKHVHNYMLLITFIIMVFLIAFQKFAYMFIGQAYRESRLFFSLMMIFPLFKLISETTSYGIAIKKKSYYTLIIYVFEVAVNLSLSYFLIKKIGLPGVAIASSLSAVLFLTLNTIIGQRFYQTISSLKKTILAPLSIYLVALANYIFYDSVLVIAIITSSISILMGFVFRDEIKNGVLYIIDLIGINYKKIGR